MNKEFTAKKKIFKDNKSELPLVLQEINIIKKKIEISGKSLQILKYRTRFYPVDGYYKHVTRL